MTTIETDTTICPSIEQRVQRALLRRSSDSVLQKLDCCRLIHADGDGIDHVTVDRFGSALLVEQHRQETNLAPILTALREQLPATTPIFVKERWGYGGNQCQATQVAGPPVSTDLTVEENGLRYRVDLADHEHVGLFLDSRPLRTHLKETSADRRMLNLFAYTGAFGMAAAAGGARSTTNLDNKRTALERARENYQLNDLPHNSRSFMKDDVFRFLKRSARGTGRYDTVVLDPPPRFRRGKGLFRAEQDYPELVALTLGLLPPGGILLAGLNALSVPDDGFEELVALGAQKAGVHIHIEEIIRAGADFPLSNSRPVARFARASVRGN